MLTRENIDKSVLDFVLRFLSMEIVEVGGRYFTLYVVIFSV